jgi:outer membrane lipoprotein SlyB
MSRSRLSHIVPALALIAGVGAATATISANAAEGCTSCGAISNIELRHQEGEASGGGAVAGALIGGLAGRKLVKGKDSGRNIGALAGAVAGGFAGNAIEKKSKSTDFYVITVKMDDGTTQVVQRDNADGLAFGQRVSVENGTLQPPPPPK